MINIESLLCLIEITKMISKLYWKKIMNSLMGTVGTENIPHQFTHTCICVHYNAKNENTKTLQNRMFLMSGNNTHTEIQQNSMNINKPIPTAMPPSKRWISNLSSTYKCWNKMRIWRLNLIPPSTG